LKIKQTPINELIPYASNSRTHSDEQVAQIAASIKEFGFNNPVLLDKQNGIIAGHGRVLAARKLGLKEVPTIELSHLTDTQRKAYVIADNKLALNAGWDDDLLSLELNSLEEMGFNLDILGWGDGLPEFAETPDYSVLDGEDFSEQLDEMALGVKKAIQIEFESEDYEDAQSLVRYWREQGAYIGRMLMEKLKQEKEKL
tara:strand:+ start:208 stop:804 length:597 start_codon:yes stop_codon:yes gene_type:complete